MFLYRYLICLKNRVIVIIFTNGDVAALLKLHYGEGVLNKAFIIELIDVILTLAFIGFFKFLKRQFSRFYQKFLSFSKKLKKYF